jgi:hypothetical protein
MAPALAQVAECVPRLASTSADTATSVKNIRLDCAGMLCSPVCLRRAVACTDNQRLLGGTGVCARGECGYKDALLARYKERTLAADTSSEAFKAYLQACDFTAQSKAFMHAELARLLNTMRVEDCSSAHTRQCPAHVRELLTSVPVLAEALFALCEQTGARYVFDTFVLSLLEHMVLIEDVIASGGKVSNARAQWCAQYVEDWTQAVVLVSAYRDRHGVRHTP